MSLQSEAEQEADAVYKEWLQVSEWLKPAKEREALLRRILIDRACADKLTPTGYLPEGTTKGKLRTTEMEIAVSVSCPYKREVLEETLAVTLAQLPEDKRVGLIKYKPELVKAAYNKLTQEEKAIFDVTLETKPGSPQATFTPVVAE